MRAAVLICVALLALVGSAHGRVRRAAAPVDRSRVSKDIAYLPDPFAFENGTRITSLSQWPALAAEHGALLQALELGLKPAVPDVAGSFSGSTLTVSVTFNGKTISFTCSVSLPKSGGAAPYPAIIGVGGVSLDSNLLNTLGIATINFPNNQVADQSSASSRGQGLFYTLYGADHSAGAMIAWAWGIDCMITALEQTAPAHQIDVKHLGVTGCSRNGKGALIAGAFVERITLALPQESGSGGADSWRVSDFMMANGIKTQTLDEIINENVWFSLNFNNFSGHTNALPVDHHMLVPLLAKPKGATTPTNERAVLMIENDGIDWLGGYSGWVNANAAQKVFAALGVADHMGFTAVSHQDHCSFQASQQPALKAFVQRYLLGMNNVTTEVLSIDGNSTIDAFWMPWTAPFLTEPEEQEEEETEECFATAVAGGYDGKRVRFEIRAPDRTIVSVQLVSSTTRPLPLFAHGLFFEALLSAEHLRAAPFTLEVRALDGAVARIAVPQLGGARGGRVFKCN